MDLVDFYNVLPRKLQSPEKKNDLKYFILILKFNKTYIYIYIELHKYDMMYVIYKIWLI